MGIDTTMSGTTQPETPRASLRASYGLAPATTIGIALVMADVARANGFESGIESAWRQDMRLVRICHAIGTMTMRVVGEGVQAREIDIALPHTVELAIARLEGVLAGLKRKEGSRTDRLPSAFVGRVDED